MAVGDFNGDGKVDLAIGDGTVLLGNGMGGFTAAPGSPFPVGGGNSIAVADFNGDRKPDLAIAKYLYRQFGVGAAEHRNWRKPT